MSAPVEGSDRCIHAHIHAYATSVMNVALVHQKSHECSASTSEDTSAAEVDHHEKDSESRSVCSLCVMEAKKVQTFRTSSVCEHIMMEARVS